MIKNFEDVQKMSQTNVDQAMKFWGDLAKNWQSVATQMTDYSKRSFEDGTQTFEKLLSVKTVEQALEIQTSFAKRAYDEYMREMNKIGGMYTEIAKEAYKPMEKAFQQVR